MGRPATAYGRNVTPPAGVNAVSEPVALSAAMPASTDATATTLSGTVDSFGLWENNPGSGNRRFDNYMILGIPEPATMSLLGVGVLGFIGRWK
jgi:hypothetical protein